MFLLISLMFDLILLKLLFLNLFVWNQYFFSLTLLFSSKLEHYSLLLILSLLLRIDNKCRLIKLLELLLSLLNGILIIFITNALSIKLSALSQRRWHSWGVENRRLLWIRIFVKILALCLFLILIVYVG